MFGKLYADDSIYGVSFSPTGAGSSILATGKTITVGSTGVFGTLVLRNFTQLGNTSQNITLNGTCNMVSSTFNGGLTLNATVLLLASSNFKEVSTLNKTGNGSDFSQGGNHFFKSVTINNNATGGGILRMAIADGDIFDENVTLNTNTGYIQMAYSDTTDFKGNITINNSKVTFNNGVGLMKFSGALAQSLGGSSNYLISKIIINKTSFPLVLQKPMVIDSLLNLQLGIIECDSTNSLTLKNNAQATGMGIQSYVDGYVKKIGNSAFTFPVGDEGEYRPVSISSPSNSSDVFGAQFIKEAQTYGDLLDTSLNYISTCNYWKINRHTGAANVNLTFDWFQPSCDVFKIDSTYLIYWNGSSWVNRSMFYTTGNDSVGAFSSSSSITSYGIFSFGNKLNPVVEYQMNIDTTVNPVKVDFANLSSDLPNNTKFFWVFNHNVNTSSDSLLMLSKSGTTHFYDSQRLYEPKLIAIYGGDTIIYQSKLNLLPPVGITLSLSLPNSHPLGSPGISACYDEIDLIIQFAQLNDDPILSPPEEITFLWGNAFLGQIVSGTVTGTPAGNYNFNLIPAMNPTGFTLDVLTGGSIFSETITLRIRLNNCQLYSEAELINLNFILNSSTTTQDAQLSTNSNDIVIDPSGNTAGIIITNIEKPEIGIEVLSAAPFSSKNGESFTREDIIDRYYRINGTAGITDMFTLDFKIEDDVEMLLCEIIDPTLSNPNSPLILFDSQNFSNTPLPPASSWKFVFAPTGWTPPSLIFQTVPIDITITKPAYVYLPNCLNVNSTSASPFLGGLCPDNTHQYNNLIVHEKLRVLSVKDCNNTPVATGGNEATFYELFVNCDESVPLGPCDKSDDESLNLKCIQPAISLGCSLVKRNIIGSAVTYSAIGNNELGVCSSSLKPELDVAIKIANNTPSISGVHADAGTISLDYIVIDFDFDHFEFSGIEIGGMPFPNYTLLPNNQLRIDLSALNVNVNSNNVPGENLDHSLNSNFPIPTTTSFKFLRPGDFITINFLGLKLKDPNIPSTYDLFDYQHKPYYIFGLINFYYIDMCNMERVNFSIWNQTDAASLGNLFRGNASSTANPLDVVFGNPTVTFVFDFEETSGKTSLNYQTRLYPWQILNRKNSAISDFIFCPDEKYYVHLNMPVPNDHYRVREYSFYDNNTNLKVGNTVYLPPIAPTGLSPNFPVSYDLECPQILPVPPFDFLKFKVEVRCDLVCDGTIGVDEFVAEFRSSCDNNCPDNYISFAQTDISVHRHCDGRCPEDSYISTKNFNLERTSLGWYSESDFYAAPNTPNIPQSYQGVRKERVYACDNIRITSFDGLCQKTIGSTTAGVNDLTNLYFDMLIDDDQLPFTTFSSTSLFSGLVSGSVNTLVITPIGLNCPGITSIPISISMSDISGFVVCPYKANEYMIRLTPDLNLTTGCPAYPTILDLLQNFACELDLELNLVVDDLDVLNGVYELDAIMGEFTGIYQPASGSPTFIQSCDPYIANLVYLEIEPTIEKVSFSGPYNSYFSINQCQLNYFMELNIYGGYPFGDDFPNEFRPVFRFPSLIDMVHHNSFTSFQTFFSIPHLNTNYLYNHSQSPTGTFLNFNQPPGTLFNNAVEKETNSMRRFAMVLDRDCPSTNLGGTSVLIDAVDILNQVVISGCGPNFALVNNPIYEATFPIPPDISEPYEIAPPIGDLTTDPANSSGDIKDCEIFNFSVKAKSLNGDVISCGFILNSPHDILGNSADLVVLNCSVVAIDNNGVQQTKPIAVPSFSITSPSILTYSWDILDILKTYFGIAEPHFNKDALNSEITFIFDMQVQGSNTIPIPANTPMLITYRLIGTSVCQNDVSEINTPINFNYEGTPSPSITTSQTPFCGTSADLTVSGPAGLSYLWSNSAQSNTINVTAVGVYTVTVTQTSPTTCISTYTFNVINQDPSVTLNANPVGYCSSGNPVTITNIDDLTNNYQYLWSTGSTTYYTPIASAGTYTVTVTNNGCTRTETITINDISPNVSIPQVDICDGSTTFISASFTNNTQLTPLYHWSTGVSTSTIPAAVGTYTVSVTIGGCTSISAPMTVTDLTPSSQINSNAPNGFCAGQNVTLQATQTNPSYTYLWSDASASTSSSIVISPSGNSTYTLTITDHPSECSVVRTIDLFDATPSVTINNGNIHQYACLPDPFVLTAFPIPGTNNGTPIYYTHQWSSTALPPMPPTSVNWINITSPQFNTLYKVIVTSISSGCSATNSVTFEDLAPHANCVPTTIFKTFPNTTTTIGPSVSTCLTCTYSWTSFPPPSTPFPNTSNLTVTPATSTTYTVIVTNTDPITGVNTCSSQCDFFIQVDNPSLLACPDPVIGGLISQDDLNLGVVSLPDGSSWFVKDDLYLNYDLILGTNVTIEFAPDKSITIPNGREFRIENGGTLRSCSNLMWNGITMLAGGKLFFRGNSTNPLLIEDAKIALEANGNGVSIDIGGDVTFNANNLGIYLRNGDFSTARFAGTKFTCNKSLLIPFDQNPYSEIHFKAENATQVFLNYGDVGGVNYGNEFSTASTCILAIKTNLTVEACKFENLTMINSGGTTGIKFLGNKNNANSVPYKLVVGSTISTQRRNDIKYFKKGIWVKDRANVWIEKNNIASGSRGIEITNNRVSTMPNYSGSIKVRINDIDYMETYGVELANNGNVKIDVIGNTINNIAAFNQLLETRKGIYLHNSTPTNSVLSISQNTIIHCRFGIQIMQQSNGTVSGNNIYYDIPDQYLFLSTFVRRQGIGLINTDNLLVTNNEIFRSLNAPLSTMDNSLIDYVGSQISLCGINSARSSNNYMQNKIYDLPTHFRVSGFNQGSTFNCNDLNFGLEGFKLINVFMSNQGTNLSPNGNRWIAWPTTSSEPTATRISATNLNGSISPQIEWNHENQNDQDPQFGITPFIPQFIIKLPSASPACTIHSCPECRAASLAELIALADTILFEEELRYAIENYVYQNLKDSLQLMYSGTVYDISLQNFFSAKALDNVGLLSNIEELLNSNDYANAYLLNEALVTDKVFEYNLETVNRICSEYDQEFEELDSLDKDALIQIAYQHADYGGEGVYRARAILGIDVDDTELSLRTAHSSYPKHKSELRLIPNPTTGIIQVSFDFDEDEFADVEVFNGMGQVIVQQKISAETNNYLLDMTGQFPGIYFLKFRLNSGLVLNEKIVLIKK
jgi:hypothetical protein